MDCPNLNLSACGKQLQQQAEKDDKIAREEKKERDDAIARKKKQDADDKFAIENPGPPDKKGCTANGDIAIKTLLANPNYGKVLSGDGDVVPVSTKGKVEDLHLRAITSAGLKLVPDVGAVLSGALDFLWTDPKADRLFDEMLTYVNRLVPDSITKERLDQQNFDVAGLQLLLNKYQDERDLFYKGLDLQHVTDRLLELQPAYLDNPDTPAEKALPLVVAYGKLRLAALREQLLHQSDYFPGHVSTSPAKQYNAAVKALTTAAASIKQKVIENRLAKLHSDSELRDDWDKLAWGGGDNPAPGQTRWYTTTDDFCDWHPEHKDDEGAAKADLEARKKAIRKAYNRDLDLLLAPITNWPSITEVARPADANGRPVGDSATPVSAEPTVTATPVVELFRRTSFP